MSVFSKYFNLTCGTSATCRDIVHPHTNSCLLAALGYFFQPIFTTTQFFIPLFMVSIYFISLEIEIKLYNQNNFVTSSRLRQGRIKLIKSQLLRWWKILLELFRLLCLLVLLEPVLCVFFSKWSSRDNKFWKKKYFTLNFDFFSFLQ